MAEFVDVLRQFDRMCKANTGCFKCPLHEQDGVSDRCSIGAFVNDSERIERVVMTWAAEHPEPVYPLWGEWLTSIGAARRVPTGIPFQLANGDIVDPPYEIEVNLYDHIPAVIAEKLGIPPKEAKP